MLILYLLRDTLHMHIILLPITVPQIITHTQGLYTQGRTHEVYKTRRCIYMTQCIFNRGDISLINRMKNIDLFRCEHCTQK